MHSKIDGNPIYEEVNIVAQAVRDNYEGGDDSAIIVSGRKGYEELSAFVKKLMPHESAKVKLYTDKMSIFKKFGIDKKLDELLNPIAPLKSGGYLVINLFICRNLNYLRFLRHSHNRYFQFFSRHNFLRNNSIPGIVYQN